MTDEEKLALWAGEALEIDEVIGIHHTKTGGRYIFLSVAIREADLSPCFVYYHAKKRLTWVRPMCDLFASEEDGRPKWVWAKQHADFFSKLHATYLTHLGEQHGPKGVHPF